MTKRSSTIITLSVKLRLPPGAKAPAAVHLVYAGIQKHVDSLPNENPLKSLPLQELVIKIAGRETKYY